MRLPRIGMIISTFFYNLLQLLQFVTCCSATMPQCNM